MVGGGDGGDVAMLFWWIGGEKKRASGCGAFVACGGGDTVGRRSTGIVSYGCFQ